MEQVWGLVALIGAAQILNSAKQLKNGVSYIELMNENIKLLKKALKFKG